MSYSLHYNPSQQPSIAMVDETIVVNFNNVFYYADEKVVPHNIVQFNSPTENVADLTDTDAKVKRFRTAFTNDQLLGLEAEFGKDIYLRGCRRSVIAKKLSLTEKQVQIWFQNRRAKAKRAQEAKNLEKSDFSSESSFQFNTDLASQSLASELEIDSEASLENVDSLAILDEMLNQTCHN